MQVISLTTCQRLSTRGNFARDWAALAKLAGIKYVVFTAKHHSGFSMFNTATTDFNIMHTPFKTICRAGSSTAFRDAGYLRPASTFHRTTSSGFTNTGRQSSAALPDVQPRNNPGLMSYDKAQLRELLTQYGQVDVLFL